MTLSMTGFSRIEASGEWGRLTWELRSVNHRYLDLTFKLPDDLRLLESELRTLAVGKMGRGKVECGLRLVREAGSADAGLQIDERRLQVLRDAMDTVSSHFPTSVPDPLQILQFPGVLQQSSVSSEALHAAVLKAFDEAINALSEARRSEGKRLADFVEVRLELLLDRCEEMRQRYPLVRDTWVDRLKARAAELQVELEPGRIEQELVIALQRLDIDEELSRLASHIAEVRKALKQREPVGRRLDFLMQELNREANTLSSKSQDSEMTRSAVDMKVAIEQMREQVQNIE